MKKLTPNQKGYLEGYAYGRKIMITQVLDILDELPQFIVGSIKEKGIRCINVEKLLRAKRKIIKLDENNLNCRWDLVA